MTGKRKRVYGYFDTDLIQEWNRNNEVMIDRGGKVKGFSSFVKRMWGYKK